MNSKNKFILKEILWNNMVLIGLLFLFGFIDYFIYGNFSFFDIPWILAIIVLGEMIGFLYNLNRLKSMGIDVGLVENQMGALNKTIGVQLPKEKILDLLKQNVWKFKTEQKEETEEGTLIKMKYYQLFWNEKIELLVNEININESSVKITAGHKKTAAWFMSAHAFWSRAITHIKYFENQLNKREELHLQVAHSKYFLDYSHRPSQNK